VNERDETRRIGRTTRIEEEEETTDHAAVLESPSFDAA